MDHLRGRKGGFCEGHFSQFGSTPIESILFRNPSRETQRELLPAIIWELRNTLDEVLLMWLAERKSVKPSLSAQLIELGRPVATEGARRTSYQSFDLGMTTTGSDQMCRLKI